VDGVEHRMPARQGAPMSRLAVRHPALQGGTHLGEAVGGERQNCVAYEPVEAGLVGGE
jgi:hypothetical protein